MTDMYCRNPRCREPWDAYYVMHEMEEEERRSFLSGKGCPSCNFGQPKDVLAKRAWAAFVERLGELLRDEHDFVWVHGEGDQEWYTLSPYRYRPLNAIRVLLLDHAGIAFALEKQDEIAALRGLLEQAAQTDDAKMLQDLRQQMLTLVGQMPLQETPVPLVPPEEDDAALQHFLEGLEAWDEDPLTLLEW